MELEISPFMRYSPEDLQIQHRARLQQLLDDVKRTRDVKELMTFGDSYERLPLLLRSYPHIDPDLFYQTLGEHWTGFDNVGTYRRVLRRAFAWASAAQLASMMGEEERQAFEALPPVLTAWRGCYGINRHGLSWTQDRKVAEKFPTLMRYSRPGDRPLLLCARVRKQGTILKLGRSEQEVIVPRRVRFTVVAGGVK